MQPVSTVSDLYSGCIGSASSFALTWDAENRLVSYAAGSVTNEYDANGLRVRRTKPGGDVVYVLAGAQPLAEYAPGAAATSPTTENVYLGGQLLAKKESGAYTFFMQDHLSVRGILSDASPNSPSEQGHLPFGESWYGSGNKWKFTSYERDSDVNDDFAMFRRYQYGVGRFSSPDPVLGSVGDPQSWNRYAYVGNDPIGLVDPSGLNRADPDGHLGYFGGGGGGGGWGWGGFPGNGGGPYDPSGYCQPQYSFCEDDPSGGIGGGSSFGSGMPGGGLGILPGENSINLPIIDSTPYKIIQGVLTGNWGPLFPAIPGYNADPWFDATPANNGILPDDAHIQWKVSPTYSWAQKLRAMLDCAISPDPLPTTTSVKTSSRPTDSTARLGQNSLDRSNTVHLPNSQGRGVPVTGNPSSGMTNAGRAAAMFMNWNSCLEKKLPSEVWTK